MADSINKSTVAFAFLGGGNRAFKYLKYITDNTGVAVAKAIVEPNELRRNNFGDMGNIDESQRFESVDNFFAQPKIADAVVICTPDATHHRYAIEALRRGYHVLLEKPIAGTMEQCIEVSQSASKKGLIVSVCHILRYHPYFKKIKELIDSGNLGKVISINHREAVGIDRACHSYVRGAWNRDDIATPMILTKFCHDTDLVTWWAGAPMSRIQSYGSLNWFNASNAPAQSSERCINCTISESCPYSAVELYQKRREWIANFDRAANESIDEVIDRELKTGRFGRCVFHCDNNVVDRQLIAMEMENGITVNMSMDLFTKDDNRSTHICLTNGEIFGNESCIETVNFMNNEKNHYDYSDMRHAKYHAGADHAIVADFINSINGSKPGRCPDSSINAILESHRICFEAERSRLNWQ